LNDSITPGAVGTLYKILGKPRFYDSTWSNSNTLTFSPTGNVGDLRYRVNETTGFVKTITTHPLPGDSLLIETKLECVISGMGAL